MTIPFWMIDAEISPCKFCGGNGSLCEPPYADDLVSVFCEECDASTIESYEMGYYREGCHKAIADWNDGKIEPYEVVTHSILKKSKL